MQVVLCIDADGGGWGVNITWAPLLELVFGLDEVVAYHPELPFLDGVVSGLI